MFACKVRAEWTFLLKPKPRDPDRVPGRPGSPPCDRRRRAQIILDALPPQAGTAGRPSRRGPLAPAVANRAGGHWRAAPEMDIGRQRPNRSPRARARDPAIDWPKDLPPGGYRLQVSDAATAEDVPLIVAPERAFGGEFDRCWLLAVQLYGVRSAANWGIGDFHRSRQPDRTRRSSRGRRRRPQSAACCSTIARPIAAPIRRTAGCFSTALYRCRKASPNSPRFETSDALPHVAAGDVVDYVGMAAALKWLACAAFAAFKASEAGRQGF